MNSIIILSIFVLLFISGCVNQAYSNVSTVECVNTTETYLSSRIIPTSEEQYNIKEGNGTIDANYFDYTDRIHISFHEYYFNVDDKLNNVVYGRFDTNDSVLVDVRIFDQKNFISYYMEDQNYQSEFYSYGEGSGTFSFVPSKTDFYFFVFKSHYPYSYTNTLSISYNFTFGWSFNYKAVHDNYKKNIFLENLDIYNNITYHSIINNYELTFLEIY